jgi:hypothetical protein
LVQIWFCITWHFTFLYTKWGFVLSMSHTSSTLMSLKIFHWEHIGWQKFLNSMKLLFGFLIKAQFHQLQFFNFRYEDVKASVTSPVQQHQPVEDHLFSRNRVVRVKCLFNHYILLLQVTKAAKLISIDFDNFVSNFLFLVNLVLNMSQLQEIFVCIIFLPIYLSKSSNVLFTPIRSSFRDR